MEFLVSSMSLVGTLLYGMLPRGRGGKVAFVDPFQSYPPCFVELTAIERLTYRG